MENFIGRYNIEEDVCDKVVKYFYKNKTRHVNGIIGKGDVAKDKKDSIDIAINGADGLTPLLKEYFETPAFLNLSSTGMLYILQSFILNRAGRKRCIFLK